MNHHYLLLLSVFLFSCGTTTYQITNSYSLNQEQAADNIDGDMYSDSLVRVTFNHTSNFYAFTLENKTDKPMYIVWEESSFIKGGSAGPILNKDVDFYDKSLPVKPTIVLPGSTRMDKIIVVESIVIDDYGARLKSLEEPMKTSSAKLAEQAAEIPSQHRIYLTLNHGDEAYAYSFLFDGKGEVYTFYEPVSYTEVMNFITVIGGLLVVYLLSLLQLDW